MVIPATRAGIEAISIANKKASFLGRTGIGDLPSAAGSVLLFREISFEILGIEKTKPAIPVAIKIPPNTKFLDLISVEQFKISY